MKRVVRNHANANEMRNCCVLNANSTLRVVMQHWLEVEKFPSVERTTYDRYESTAKNHIYPFLGSYPLNTLTREELKGLMDSEVLDGFAYNTIKKTHSILKSFFDYAIDQRILEKNPFANVHMVKKSTVYAKQNKEEIPLVEEITIFEEDEIQKLKYESFKCKENGCRCYQQAAVYCLLLNTGLRISELMGLLNKDIDLENHVLYIRHGAKEVNCRDKLIPKQGRELYIGKPKSRASRRSVPLNAVAIQMILDLRKERYLGESTPLVCDKKGNYIRPNNIRKRFYRILKAAGIEQKGLHSLRHTFASKLVNGIKQPDGSLLCLPIRQVADILGHSTTQVTEMYYVKKDTARLHGVTDDFCF